MLDAEIPAIPYHLVDSVGQMIELLEQLTSLVEALRLFDVVGATHMS